MRKLDLAGKTFNRLTVIKEVPSPENDSHWLCQCECGNLVEIRGTAIKSGITRSCGCLAKEIASNLIKTNSLDIVARRGYEDKRVDGIATFLINEKMQKNNTSGYKGVQMYRLPDGSVRYKAYLTVGKKSYQKRGFKTAVEAYNYRLGLIDKHVPKKGDKNEI